MYHEICDRRSHNLHGDQYSKNLFEVIVRLLGTVAYFVQFSDPGELKSIEKHGTIEESKSIILQVDPESTCLIYVPSSDCTFIAVNNDYFKTIFAHNSKLSLTATLQRLPISPNKLSSCTRCRLYQVGVKRQSWKVLYLDAFVLINHQSNLCNGLFIVSPWKDYQSMRHKMRPFLLIKIGS